jgi:ABC-type polysaccharide/polyol phosphate transport system ATPase subunit
MEWMTWEKKVYHQDFWALRNISFQLKKGDCLGIIGPNGSGKSTLLKILTRSLYPTSGIFQIQGRVLSLLELGTGFNVELTGRQNIYRSSELLGFPEGYVNERIREIEGFAEIGDFFDRPIKTYSSGMYIRLAFSMFVFLKPEVLIIDEVLSVGDIFFQQKCFAKMREMMAADTTCLLASHDMGAVRNLCSQAIFLNHGEIDFQGKPEETVSRYFAKLGRQVERNANSSRSENPERPEDATLLMPEKFREYNFLSGRKGRHGAGGLEIVAARITDSNGRDTLRVEMQERLFFHLLLQARDTILDPNVGIDIYDRFGNLVFASGAANLRRPLPDLSKGDQMVIRIDLTMNVQPGEYSFALAAAEPSADQGPDVGYIHDRHEMLGPILVTFHAGQLYPFYGIAKLPMEIRAKVIKNEV